MRVIFFCSNNYELGSGRRAEDNRNCALLGCRVAGRFPSVWKPREVAHALMRAGKAAVVLDRPDYLRRVTISMHRITGMTPDNYLFDNLIKGCLPAPEGFPAPVQHLTAVVRHVCFVFQHCLDAHVTALGPPRPPPPCHSGQLPCVCKPRCALWKLEPRLGASLHFQFLPC